MTTAKPRSTTDDKVEAKRKIIRQSLDQIAAEVVSEMRRANLRSPINIVVPSRHSLVIIASAHDLPRAEWSRISAIAREIVAKRLGGNELRGRPLARSVAIAATDATETTAG